MRPPDNRGYQTADPLKHVEAAVEHGGPVDNRGYQTADPLKPRLGHLVVG